MFAGPILFYRDDVFNGVDLHQDQATSCSHAIAIGFQHALSRCPSALEPEALADLLFGVRSQTVALTYLLERSVSQAC